MLHEFTNAMSTLHGEQLIGRIDPKLDRKTKTLHIHAIHAEPDAPQTKTVRAAIRQATEELAQFLDASRIVYGNERNQAG